MVSKELSLSLIIFLLSQCVLYIYLETLDLIATARVHNTSATCKIRYKSDFKLALEATKSAVTPTGIAYDFR